MSHDRDIPTLKTQAKNIIEAHRAELVELGLRIHAHPETAMQEHQAAAWITSVLKNNSFAITTGICDMPTAFRAVYGSGRPRIAFIAEYDALPGLGHACGHNLIATAAVAAAIGSRPAVDSLGGSVLVIGTPAEELQGGKIEMIARGAFNDIDAALMAHPSSYDSAAVKALACACIYVEFFGKEAHAAAQPEEGINALEAMILSFNAVNSLRQHIEDGARIHGIITDGGRAANIVPGHAAGHFLVRADNLPYLEKLKARVLACMQGAALASGARLEYRWEEKEYAPMLNHPELTGRYISNMAALGNMVPLFNPDSSFGSTDMGNLSQHVPALHAEVAVAAAGTGVHTTEFACLAGEEASFVPMMRSAAGLAMTAIDLLADASCLKAETR
jgi:amidohydrolase